MIGNTALFRLPLNSWISTRKSGRKLRSARVTPKDNSQRYLGRLLRIGKQPMMTKARIFGVIALPD
jgi:hypothetical protein